MKYLKHLYKPTESLWDSYAIYLLYKETRSISLIHPENFKTDESTQFFLSGVAHKENTYW